MNYKPNFRGMPLSTLTLVHRLCVCLSCVHQLRCVGVHMKEPLWALGWGGDKKVVADQTFRVSIFSLALSQTSHGRLLQGSTLTTLEKGYCTWYVYINIYT